MPDAGARDATLSQAQAAATHAGLELAVRTQGLTLTDGTLDLTCDFSQLLPRLRQDRLAHEHLVRAARIKGKDVPVVADATAGLGEDSLLLASAGCRVLMFESNPVIAALLRDGLVRAAKIPQLASAVARMQLFEEDSIAALSSWQDALDVVYLDPMFPARTKSAAVKKKFQLLHRLERPESDEQALFAAALAARPQKVVIKRPLKAAPLADVRPSYSFRGKAVRFDVVVPPPHR